jgi:hypothetical protein
MKHRLNPEALAVQSFDTQTLSDDEAFMGVESKTQCISELSACGICPTDPNTYA